ncbi:MAG TPA: hypothetical protein VL240_10545 [Candidatus Binatia bacterium]|nr:hypothetical protein [Candidatus Binatia bacterium]
MPDSVTRIPFSLLHAVSLLPGFCVHRSLLGQMVKDGQGARGRRPGELVILANYQKGEGAQVAAPLCFCALEEIRVRCNAPSPMIRIINVHTGSCRMKAGSIGARAGNAAWIK